MAGVERKKGRRASRAFECVRYDTDWREYARVCTTKECRASVDDSAEIMRKAMAQGRDFDGLHICAGAMNQICASRASL